jgi:5-methylcytosine-specific restriction enzyme A
MTNLPTPCNEPGCDRLTRSGSRCQAHTASRWPDSRGHYDAAWRRLRNSYIERHRFCEARNCLLLADEVDHIISIENRPDLRLVESNLQALCMHHHRSKTARASNRRDR